MKCSSCQCRDFFLSGLTIQLPDEVINDMGWSAVRVIMLPSVDDEVLKCSSSCTTESKDLDSMLDWLLRHVLNECDVLPHVFDH